MTFGQVQIFLDLVEMLAVMFYSASQFKNPLSIS